MKSFQPLMHRSSLLYAWPVQMGIFTALVALTALARLLPHPPNFAPVAALALFAGVHCRSRILAACCPLAAMLASDLWIGFAPPLVTLAVYVCFAGLCGVGILLRRTSGGAWGTFNLATASLAASTIFFLGTNLAVWAGSSIYEQSAAGLAACYAAAVPFFGYTIAGDLCFCTAMFGGFAVARALLRSAEGRPVLEPPSPV